MKRTVLQMRRLMKIMGMSVSFISAMETEWDDALLARMGRYSDRAACCVRQRALDVTTGFMSVIITRGIKGHVMSV